MMSSVKKTVIGELEHIKRKEEEELSQKRAHELELPYFNLDIVPINVSDLILIPEPQARKAKAALIRREGNVVMLASLHPDSPEVEIIQDQLKEKGFTVKRAVVSLSSLTNAWETYKFYKEKGKELRKIFLIEEERANALIPQLSTRRKVEQQLARLKEEDTNPFLEILFIAGVGAKANDIHIEPEEEGAKIRFRIDGVLEDIMTIPSRLYKLTLNRLKVLAELKLNVTEVPQDGRFTVRQKQAEKDNDMDVRISLIPSYYGETIVMRLLGVAVVPMSIDELGMNPHQKETLVANLSLPNGMILTTGPTGSGKTTLLYAALTYVQKPEINIVTVENPIEYQVEGITQTQVNEAKGYTFEKGLQSLLRQDPDVVMIGEIRSEETADAAINAALTGHLVFSTLHTNDAPGAIERLQNLHLRINLIPAAIRLIIAQRLVRKLCPHCKQKVPIPTRHKEAIKEAISLISPHSQIEIPAVPDTMYIPKGCEACFGIGYAGRTGIFELLEMNDYVEEKILASVTIYELRKAAIENGMLTLLQHGILKVIRGETSLEEVQRVAGDAAYIEELYGQAVLSILSRTLFIPEDMLKEVATLSARTPEEAQKFFEKTPEQALERAFLAFAIHVGASDIHIEPKEDGFEIGYRIDGILYPFARLRSELYTAVLGNIKEFAGMKVGMHKRIQEGRFSAAIKEKEFRIDVRVSLVPGGYGEVVVMRILHEEFTFSLEVLGIPEPIRLRLEKEVRQPNGLILATGPTGSGKTTTLYSLLQLIIRDKKKIITIENPIEYKLPEILQTQIDPKAGYDFPDAMRAILRQDPDVILIGEVRDNLTAKTVFQAASTGHLVFSTLHTNDALGVLERLYSLDMPAEQVANILNVIIAQRLVRKLCPHCKKTIKPSSQFIEKIRSHINLMPSVLKPSVDLTSLKLYEEGTCSECSTSGFKGRIGIFEIVFVSDEAKALIRRKAEYRDLVAEVRKTGSVFFKEDATLKLIEGVTSPQEVERVLGEL